MNPRPTPNVTLAQPPPVPTRSAARGSISSTEAVQGSSAPTNVQVPAPAVGSLETTSSQLSSRVQLASQEQGTPTTAAPTLAQAAPPAPTAGRASMSPTAPPLSPASTGSPLSTTSRKGTQTPRTGTPTRSPRSPLHTPSHGKPGHPTHGKSASASTIASKVPARGPSTLGRSQSTIGRAGTGVTLGSAPSPGIARPAPSASKAGLALTTSSTTTSPKAGIQAKISSPTQTRHATHIATSHVPPHSTTAREASPTATRQASSPTTAVHPTAPKSHTLKSHTSHTSLSSIPSPLAASKSSLPTPKFGDKVKRSASARTLAGPGAGSGAGLKGKSGSERTGSESAQSRHGAGNGIHSVVDTGAVRASQTQPHSRATASIEAIPAVGQNGPNGMATIQKSTDSDLVTGHTDSKVSATDETGPNTSSSTHDPAILQRLHDLERRYSLLQREYARCNPLSGGGAESSATAASGRNGANGATSPGGPGQNVAQRSRADTQRLNGAGIPGHGKGQNGAHLTQGTTSEVAALLGPDVLPGVVRAMGKDARLGLLAAIADAFKPSDIQAQIELLESLKHLRTGILARLDDALCDRVLRFLGLRDLLGLRLVSKRFNARATAPVVWRRLCRELEATWDGTIDLSNYQLGDDGDWLGLYKRLWQREKHWTDGQAQSVVLLSGHTNYVTSLRLSGETLITGSYDDTMRVWHLPYAVASARHVPPPQVIPIKAVSSIDYYAPEQVIATGSHDVGRATVWKQVEGEWRVDKILSGHLHGTRIVAINAQWLVSVGADKAIVVWDWRTGGKIVRFGQQTNVCVGMRLLDNYVISATVDGVIRTFSIGRREMLGQFRLSHLGQLQPEYAERLKDVGSGALTMLTWFEAEGRFMACATRDMVIRLEWDWAAPDEVAEQHESMAELNSRADALLGSPLATPARHRGGTASPVASPRSASPRMASHSPARSLGSPKSGTAPKLSPGKPAPLQTPSKLNQSTTTSEFDFAESEVSGGATVSPTATTFTTNTARTRTSNSTSTTTNTPQTPTASNTTHTAGNTTTSNTTTNTTSKFALGRAPRIVEICDLTGTERGAFEAGRVRIVTSRRLSAKSGAERRVIVGTEREWPGDVGDDAHEGQNGESQAAGKERRTMKLVPLGGAWNGVPALSSNAKNPMSLALDHDKLVYGCSDGSIVVANFVGLGGRG